MSYNPNFNQLLSIVKKSGKAISFDTLVKKTNYSNLIGGYKSKAKGSGLIFKELREYQAGDEVKNIHWKASARTNHVYVKSYEEEKNLNIHLLLDTSSSIYSSTTKNIEKICNFTVQIGLNCIKNNDSFGVSTFGKDYNLINLGGSGKKEFRNTLNKLEENLNESSESNLNHALVQLYTNLKKRHLIFIVSDFYTSEFKSELSKLSKKHDIVCLLLLTNLEQLFATKEMIRINCKETKRRSLIDITNKKTQESITANMDEHINNISKICRELNLKCIPVYDKNIFSSILNYR